MAWQRWIADEGSGRKLRFRTAQAWRLQRRGPCPESSDCHAQERDQAVQKRAYKVLAYLTSRRPDFTLPHLTEVMFLDPRLIPLLSSIPQHSCRWDLWEKHNAGYLKRSH